MSLTYLFDVVSIEFAGPFPTTDNVYKYYFIAVEHLTGWPIQRSTKDASSDTVTEVGGNFSVRTAKGYNFQ